MKTTRVKVKDKLKVDRFDKILFMLL